MKTKRSVLNIITNLLNQLLTIALGILIPRLVLTNLGSEANGLMNSITQVFAYINLLEAGVGIATVQALYKPLEAGDRDGVNGILTATKQYYFRIAWVYLAVLFGFAGLYPLLVTSGYAHWQVALVILLTGGNSFFNFLFQGKYRILLEAEGKLYIITNINSLIFLATSVCKSVLLICGFDLVEIQLGFFLINLLQLVIIELYMHKNYRWIDFGVKPNFGAIAQKDSVLVHQFSTVIFSNTSVLLLSFFCDLKIASVYAVYQLVVGMINTAFVNVVGSIQFAFGQKYTSDLPRFKKLLNAFEAYYNCLAGAVFAVTLLLLIPFVRIYTDGVQDVVYVDALLAILFVTRELTIFGRVASQISINVAGHFKNTMYRSLTETGINLVVSVVGVLLFGIYGVLLGTIVAVLYRTNDMILYSHRHILKTSPKKSYLHWLVNVGLCVAAGAVGFPLFYGVSTLGGFVLGGIVLVAVLFPVFFLVNSLLDREAFGVLREYAGPKLSGLWHRIRGKK